MKAADIVNVGPQLLYLRRFSPDMEANLGPQAAIVVSEVMLHRLPLNKIWF